MFQVEDNRSGVIMFFLLDETCEFVFMYEMVTWDFNDSQNSSSFNVLEILDRIEELCDVRSQIILALSRVLLAVAEAMLRALCNTHKFHYSTSLLSPLRHGQNG
jgi:hypothetical protein